MPGADHLPLEAQPAAPPRRRVLCILGKSPLPDDTGSRRRLLRLVTAAAEHHEVTVLVVSSSISDRERALLDAAPWRAVVIPRARRRPGLGAGLRWLLGSIPHDRLVHPSDDARTAVGAAVDAERPDVLWVDDTLLAEAVVPPTDVPVAIDMSSAERPLIDSELRAWTRQPLRRRLGSWKAMLVLALDRRARIRCEARALSAAALVTPCSEVEAEIARSLTTGAVAMVENGVDTDDRLGPLPVDRRLLFVGNLHYRPNAEAVTILVEEVLPILRRRDPSITLDVVGAGAEAVPILAAAPGVTVHGFVDDLAARYRAARLVVAPIAAGSGTKLKVLEAFAHGVPVVTTAEGVAGLDITADAATLAETSEDLATAASALLDDPDREAAQRTAAWEWVIEHHSWVAIGARFGAALTTVAPRPDPSR